MLIAAAVCLAVLLASSTSADAPPIPGLTAAPAVAAVYDAILDADFDAVPARLENACGPAAEPACAVLRAVALWWETVLDPESRRLDPALANAVERAIAEAEAWTRKEPDRAEAWFYLGGAYGARAQFRVLRRERLAAARDGKQIKEALERALALDPAMQDAKFGLGMYRYYADVAPTALRMLRWLLMLPGGNRRDGLAQMQAASEQGQVVTGEAAYQLHLVYLWYEKRFADALRLVERLQRRYPRNPHFLQVEAEIHDVYFHDADASLAASMRLLEAARDGRVNRAPLASVVARLNAAKQLQILERTAEARAMLDAIVNARPTAPAGALSRAHAMLKALDARKR